MRRSAETRSTVCHQRLSIPPLHKMANGGFTATGEAPLFLLPSPALSAAVFHRYFKLRRHNHGRSVRAPSFSGTCRSLHLIVRTAPALPSVAASSAFPLLPSSASHCSSRLVSRHVGTSKNVAEKVRSAYLHREECYRIYVRAYSRRRNTIRREYLQDMPAELSRRQKTMQPRHRAKRRVCNRMPPLEKNGVPTTAGTATTPRCSVLQPRFIHERTSYQRSYEEPSPRYVPCHRASVVDRQQRPAGYRERARGVTAQHKRAGEKCR